MQYELDRDAIKKALKSKNMTYVDFVAALAGEGHDVSEVSVKKWLQFKNPLRPSMDSIYAIAKVLNLGLDDFVNIIDDTSGGFLGGRMSVKSVPIVGEASCGLPITNSYQDNETICVPKDIWAPDLYARRACGDSMSPEIDNGDIIVCDPTAIIKNGDLVHYTLFNDTAVKIYFKDENETIKLIPRNHSAEFRTLNIMKNDTEMLENFNAAKVISIIKMQTNNRLARLKAVGMA